MAEHLRSSTGKYSSSERIGSRIQHLHCWCSKQVRLREITHQWASENNSSWVMRVCLRIRSDLNDLGISIEAKMNPSPSDFPLTSVEMILG